MFLGVVGGVADCYLLPLLPAFDIFTCLKGVLVRLGVGFVYNPSVAVLSQWFSQRRSLASGISAAGSGIGGPILSLATGSVIENIGLAWSLGIIAVLTFSANSTAATFIRDRNSIISHPSLLSR